MDQKQGVGTLLVANISKRSIVVHYECYDKFGSKTGDGYSTVEPGHINADNNFNLSDDERQYMYCKLWFNGSKNEIRASFIMSTCEGAPGSEVQTPVYGVALS